MKSNYEEKRQARLDAFDRLAEKNDEKATASFGRAKAMGSMIPMGQPILVGHHSEKRHRRDIEKIDNAMRASVEASKKADYYRDRAESTACNTAISSDDPNALEKLQEKLEKLTKKQELFKAVNKIVRSKKTTEIQMIEQIMVLGTSEATAKELILPDRFGGMGIPRYELTNNNANIKTVEKRIARLKKVESIPHSEEEINGVRMVVSPNDNRVQLFFPGKPSEEKRTQLKRNGFRWAPSVGAWMAYLNAWNIQRAKTLLQ